MGNESSTPVDEDVPSVTLKDRTIESLAEFMTHANSIIVMTGAGISTSAGIPDFRSPLTGLYANLARLNLPTPESVFELSFFRQNPLPFYTLAHELYPGRYRPTVTHAFISLIHKKGKLFKLFTQNIDCLEREAGVPDDKIIEAHGSFATQRCIECKVEYPDDRMKEAIRSKKVPRCITTTCDGLVKPDIVFFGEALPEAFHRNRAAPSMADLAIVMGTSLSVQPFASLPGFVSEGTPRLLINQERVGGLGSRPDDVLILGDCDEGVRKLADALGWREELEREWERSNPDKGKRQDQNATPRTKHQKLEDEIEKLTRDIDMTLKVSGDHAKVVKDHLDRELEKKKDRIENEDVSQEPDLNRYLSSTANRTGPKVEANGDGLGHVYVHINNEDDADRPEKPSL
jgi:NAD-dependent histone deacetylase SIR2